MEKFFLGGNTAQGFKGFYGSELARADNVVLLKGAPGTGKSTLIKRLGAECAERGLDHEMWYCSGDPSSADGIFIKELSTAVVDATSPHPCEPSLPVIRERIVDMAVALDRRVLLGRKGSIEKLLADKKRSYARAYELLKCAFAHLLDAQRAYAEREDVCRIRRLAAAFALRESGGARGGELPRNVFHRAITPDGTAGFFEHLAGRRVFAVDGSVTGAYIFLKEAAGLIPSSVILHHPLDPDRVDGVLWEGCALTRCPGLFRTAAEKVELDDAAGARAEERDVMLCRGKVRDAERELASAKAAHLEVEKLHAEGMDYAVTESLGQRVKELVFEGK